MSRLFEVFLIILLATGSFALLMLGFYLFMAVRIQLALFAG